MMSGLLLNKWLGSYAEHNSLLLFPNLLQQSPPIELFHQFAGYFVYQSEVSKAKNQ